MFTFPIALFGPQSAIPDPEHYWVMSGTAGETDQGVGTARDLTENGAVGETTGLNGNCRGVFADANSLSNASLAGDYSSASPWSMTLWAKHSTGSISGPPYNSAIFETNGTTHYLWFSTTTNLLWQTAGTLNHACSAISTGWHLIAMGWDGTNRWLSVDNATPSTSAGNYGDPFTYLGEYSNWYWSGHIDEVAIFNSDIRGDALDALYNSGSGRFWDGSAWS